MSAEWLREGIVEVLGVHRWKTMGVSSVECECGQIAHGPEGLTEFPADEAFRGHIAASLAPLIASAERKGYEQGKAAIREAVEVLMSSWPTDDNGQDYRRAVTQCAAAIRAALDGTL